MGKPLVVLGGKSLYNYDTESIKENTDKSDYKKKKNFHIVKHTGNKSKTRTEGNICNSHYKELISLKHKMHLDIKTNNPILK